jgi:DNA-binding XRE family transcriptional regulator
MNYRVIDSFGVDFEEILDRYRSNFTEADWRNQRAIDKLFDVSLAIEVRRKQRNVAKRDLASVADLSSKSITAIEMCDYYPEFDKVVRILEELGVEIELRDRATGQIIREEDLIEQFRVIQQGYSQPRD